MSIFQDKSGMPPDAGKRDAPTEPPLTVHSIMTPGQQRAVADANYPRWNWDDVSNVRRPRRGYGY